MKQISMCIRNIREIFNHVKVWFMNMADEPDCTSTSLSHKGTSEVLADRMGKLTN